MKVVEAVSRDNVLDDLLDGLRLLLGRSVELSSHLGDDATWPEAGQPDAGQPDAGQPAAMSSPDLLSVPVADGDGEFVGTLSCASERSGGASSHDDLRLLTVFADMIGSHVGPRLAWDRRARSVNASISRVLAAGGPGMALQPIVEVATGRVRIWEALARFPSSIETWTTDRWFREAATIDRGPALESAAVRVALGLLPRVPIGARLAINVSAGALCESDDLLAQLLGSADVGRVVIELTEHAQVHDYAELTTRLATLREWGALVGVDDAGSGYAGLEHILNLRPDVLKLDRALVEGVASHAGRQAMCLAMVDFSRRTGADLVAEGIEEAEDLLALERLGVPLVQGYFVGRPVPADTWPLPTTADVVTLFAPSQLAME